MRRDLAWLALALAAAAAVVFAPLWLFIPAVVVALGVPVWRRAVWRDEQVDRRMVRAGTVLVFESGEMDGGWTVTSVSGVATQGETLVEAARNALDSFVAVEDARIRT